MLIDFTTIMKNIDGTPFIFDEKELTLATVAITSLLGSTEDTNKLTADLKVHRATLAQEIYRQSAAKSRLDIMAEDVALLKDAIGKAYAPLVIKRAWDILDPKVEEVDKAASH